jgi:hypothetical protein
MFVGNPVKDGESLSREVQNVVGTGQPHHVPVGKFFRAKKFVKL